MRQRKRRHFNTAITAFLRQRVHPIERLTISGSELIAPDGTPIILRGPGQGTWGENYAQDAIDIAATGANSVRTVFRWWGKYAQAGTDSRTENVADDFLNQSNLAQLLQEVDWLTAQGLWVIVAFDSNCGQYGAQDTAMEAYCDPEGAYPGGHNFWTDPEAREFFKTAWRRLARELRNRPRIAMYEILPEPLQGYNSTWDEAVKDFYREIADAINLEDDRTPKLVGPRNAYEINIASSVYMPERNDIVYTGNMLNPKVVNQDTTAVALGNLIALRDTYNVPIYVQQMGRQTVNDTNLTAMNGVMSLANANRVGYSWWQWHQNTTNPDEYALFYKDGVGGWVPKTAELARFEYYMNQSYAGVLADAITQATAINAELLYIKDDLSNVFQDAGGSIAAAVGFPIGRINAVVGTLWLQQTTSALRPILAKGINGYYVVFNGVDQYLQLSSPYFADGNDTIVISAGKPSNTSSGQTMFHTGAANTNGRYPHLTIQAAGTAFGSWRGDNTNLRSVVTTTNCANRAVVLTLSKIGDDKKIYVNGLQEGVTNTELVGGLSSITRTRVGSATTATGYWNGPISMWCFAKTMNDTARFALERLGAYQMGAPYRN